MSLFSSLSPYIKDFKQFYVLFFNAGNYLLFKRWDRYEGGFVTVIKTSSKCYRVSYGAFTQACNKNTWCEYRSFRNLYELGFYLNELVGRKVDTKIKYGSPFLPKGVKNGK